MIKLIFSCCLFFYISNAYSVTYSYRPLAYALSQKSYEISVNARYFDTIGSFDVQGTEEELAEGNSYNLQEAGVKLKYGFRENMAFTLEGSFRQVTSTTETTDRSNSGLNAVAASLFYHFSPEGSHRTAIELKYINKPFSNTIYGSASEIPDDELVLGDDENLAQFIIHYSFSRTQRHYIAGEISYNYHSEELSDDVRYDLNTFLAYTNWAFGIGVDGKYSLAQSEYEDASLRPIESNGTSRLFNSIDQTYIKPYLAINYGSNSWRVSLQIKQTLQGSFVDKGNEALLNLTWSSNAKYDESIKIAKFKEYSVEGTVIKISPRGKFIKIDQGLSGDISKGMKFDIYQTDFFGGNILVASGIAYEVGSDWSIIKLTKKYKNIAVKKGFSARGQ